MKKIMVTFIITFLVTAVAMLGAFLTGTGYFLGNYVVEFGLERGTAQDPKAPPRAYALVMPPNPGGYTQPDFPAEDWRIAGEDGTPLVGTHFSPGGWSHRWVIALHGYGCTQENSWYIAANYLHMGYHVVTPDLRGAGESGGHYVTLGHDESLDVRLWAERILQADPQAKIVLHGVSMGAATAMLAAGRGDLPEAVVAVVEDSGYTSAYDLIAYHLEHSFGLPPFPLLSIMDWRCEKSAGFRLADTSPFDAVAKQQLPILFIHGTADTLVPPKMSEELYHHAASTTKDLLKIEGATHAATSQKDQKRYFETIQRFVGPYMGK